MLSRLSDSVSKIMRMFERVAVMVLSVMLVVVIAVLLINLAFTLAASIDLREPVTKWIEYQEVREVFGAFLVVLIGIELMETMRFYLRRNVFRLEVVFTVALVAVVRHVLDLDLQHGSALSLVGTGVLVLALAVGYYLVLKTPRRAAAGETAQSEGGGAAEEK